jgi:hypothetical protein
MIIEMLGNQYDHRDELREQVIFAYKKLTEKSCSCNHCQNNLIKDFDNWHPEDNLNDSFKLLDLIGQFSYWKIDEDHILYTVTINDYNGGDNNKIHVTGDGLSVAQAICNAFLAASKQILL